MTNLVYAIVIPSSTKTLKTIYYKHLEVFVCERADTANVRSGRYQVLKAHKYKKSTGWVDVLGPQKILFLPKPADAPIFNQEKSYNGSETFLTFHTLEDAKDSKIMLLANVRKKYEEELEKMRKAMAKNDPGLDDLIHEVKMKHAELFL